MNIIFIYQWLQASQLFMAILVMSAFVFAPIAPLRAQENNSSRKPFPNGTYLYGQSQQANQIGSSYIVFEVIQDQLIGALYMPHSEFSCFRGEVQGNEVVMTVDHPYEDTTHPYAIALAPTSPIADRNGDATNPLGLQGYHLLEEISENDERMLAVCKKEFR